MGGQGSGRRWHFEASNTTEDYRSIDVRRWKREGLLNPGQSFRCKWSRNGEITASINVTTGTERVFLSYRTRNPGSDWQDMNYPVRLVTTPCHLGGERHWFLCPAKGCGRRVAVLYGGAVYACRYCHQLTYQSQRERPMDRSARRADRIRVRLDWPDGILEGSGWGKPKGMHWKTYERLCREHDRHVDVVRQDFVKRFGVTWDGEGF